MPAEDRKDYPKLFSEYTFCPRNPYGESSREEHERLGLVHHFAKGHACCTSLDSLPPTALRF